MRPNSSDTGKRRKNRSRGARKPPSLSPAAREACEEILGVSFKDPTLLDRALTHRSAAHGDTARLSNERLEFLGDRVLGLVVSEALLETFPLAREGELAPRLNAVVSRETCAQVGAALGVGAYLLTDKSERDGGAAEKPTLLANAMEAILGAVYLDRGLSSARAFVKRHWKAPLSGAATAPREPKSALQEWAQGLGRPAPVYSLTDRQGPDHSPIFTASVHVEGAEDATGQGSTKQEAERAAARAMLEAQEKLK
ncbi:MAG: ribonuclease III [Hyphomonadaceae bacterium]